MQAFCAQVRALMCLRCLSCGPVCTARVMVSLLLKAEQFARGEVNVQQITVFASLSTHTHMQEEILVYTAQILLSVYPLDYILQIIGDNRVAQSACQCCLHLAVIPLSIPF